MAKRGYPDGSVGIVIPWGDEYAPGQPALLSEKIVRVTSKDILDLLFTSDVTPEVEVHTPKELAANNGNWIKIKEKYGNLPIVEITNDVTLIPKFINDILILHAIVGIGGKITFSGVGEYVNTILDYNTSNPSDTIGGKISPTTQIQITAPVYLIAVEYHSLNDEDYHLVASSNNQTTTTLNESYPLPGGVYALKLTLGGNYDFGVTAYAKLNGTTVSTADYNPTSNAFFNGTVIPVKIDTPSTLGLTTSGSMHPTREFIEVIQIEEPDYSNPKASTYTASETSTTASTTTAMSDVKPHRFRNISVQVSIASGGGSVKVLMNGNVVAEYTSSGTYTLPDFENITKLAFEVAGDGTNASSVTFNAIEEVKDLIVASLL